MRSHFDAEFLESIFRFVEAQQKKVPRNWHIKLTQPTAETAGLQNDQIRGEFYIFGCRGSEIGICNWKNTLYVTYELSHDPFVVLYFHWLFFMQQVFIFIIYPRFNVVRCGIAFLWFEVVKNTFLECKFQPMCLDVGFILLNEQATLLNSSKLYLLFGQCWKFDTISARENHTP